MTTEINFDGDIARLECKPGDCFVLSMSNAIPPEHAAVIHEEWAKLFYGRPMPPLLIAEVSAAIRRHVQQSLAVALAQHDERVAQ